MKKLKMKKIEALSMLKVISDIPSEKNNNFKYFKLMNINILTKVNEIYETMIKSAASDKYQEFQTKRIEKCEELCNRFPAKEGEEKGQAIIVNNQYSFDKDNQVNINTYVAELQEEYKDALTSYDSEMNTIQETFNQEEEFELVDIDLKDIPENLEEPQFYTILKLIKN